MQLEYPGAPWHLKGTACVAIWRVRVKDVPVRGPGAPPALFGRCLVATVWACYEPGGTLAYKELAVGSAGLLGLRPALTTHDIWVDDIAAALGGRELWAIPKRLASFNVRSNAVFQASAADGGLAIGAVRFARRLVVPGRWSFLFTIAQPGVNGPKLTPAHVRARIDLGRAVWTFAPSGPLAFLAGRRPLASLRLSDMMLHLGVQP